MALAKPLACLVILSLGVWFTGPLLSCYYFAILFLTELLPALSVLVLDCCAPIFNGSLNMLLLKEGAISSEPLDEGAFTLRTVYLLLVGDGCETIVRAIPSMSRPSVIAIDSKSASFSAAN